MTSFLTKSFVKLLNLEESMLKRRKNDDDDGNNDNGDDSNNNIFSQKIIFLKLLNWRNSC